MHGLRNDIDEKTPTNNVKAPNVFERAKEEIEALVQTIHQKKESNSHDSPSKGERRFGRVENQFAKTNLYIQIHALKRISLSLIKTRDAHLKG